LGEIQPPSGALPTTETANRTQVCAVKP